MAKFGGFGGKFIRCERNSANRFAKISFGNDRIDALALCQRLDRYVCGILAAMTNTVPLVNLMDGQISALRHWAIGRAREAASRNTPARNGRRMAEAN